MGFTATSASGKALITTGSQTADNRLITITSDVSIVQSNEHKARFLAGDTMFIVNIRKVPRSLRFSCLVQDFGTINILNEELVDQNLWTFAISDHDSTAMTLDGSAIKGYLKRVDYKLAGVEYDVELEWSVKKG